MKRRNYKRNLLLDLPRVGPTEAARIFGWKSPLTFKRHLSEMPKIRTVRLLRGTFYILEDILRVRFPEADDKRINAMAVEYQSQNVVRRSNHRKKEVIGPTECARIFGWRSPLTFKRHLPELLEIRSVERPRGMFYIFLDVFAAAYPEASPERLNDLIVDYKQRRTAERLKRRRKIAKKEPNARKEHENAHSEPK